LRIRPTNLQPVRRAAPLRDRGAGQRRRGARGPAGHRRPLLQLSHHRRLVATGGVAPRQADGGARPAQHRRRRARGGERAGGGPALAFRVIGAPWLDTGAVLPRLRGAGRWAQEGLNGVEVSGVVFTPRTPTDGKYDGVEVRGIRLRVTDRRRYDPTRAAVLVLR